METKPFNCMLTLANAIAYRYNVLKKTNEWRQERLIRMSVQQVYSNETVPAPPLEYIPGLVCENPECKGPIPVVAPDAKRKLPQNIRAKRFCSDRCRSYKYWLDHKTEMQARRGMKKVSA